MELSMSRDYAKIIARAWIDPSFKARLMEDPDLVLSEYGISLPEGTDFSNFMLPSGPADVARDMSVTIHTCPEHDDINYEAVTACPAPMDLVHEQNLGVANCPAE